MHAERGQCYYAVTGDRFSRPICLALGRSAVARIGGELAAVGYSARVTQLLPCA
jgi:hypothetical protein